MADDDEVTQRFVADASEYIRPLEEAEEVAQRFADANREATEAVEGMRNAAAESGGSIDELAQAEGDATEAAGRLAEAEEHIRNALVEASEAVEESSGGLEGMAGAEEEATEAAANFAEAEDRIRNALAESDHELHEQTESFFAQAFAEDAAAEAADRFAAAQDRAAQRATSYEGTLRELRNVLGDLDLGEAVVARKTDLNTFSLAAENEELEKTKTTSVQAGTGIRLLDDAMDKARDQAAELAAAAALLNIDLKETDRVANEARDALVRMGAAEGEASAGALALAAAVRAAKDAEDKLSEGGGFFSLGGGGGSVLTTLMDPGSIAAFAAGVAVLAPAIAAIVVELTGLVSGFVAAGAGVGAFVALAIPAFDKVKDGYTAVTTAQGKYQQALAAERKDDDAANIKATATALAGLKKAYDSMDPAERGAVRGIEELKASYERMAKAFEPDVFKIFNQGLKIANDLLPTLKPFADTAAKAIDGLLQKLGKFFQTSKTIQVPDGLHGGMVDEKVPTGFGTFLDQLNKINGPALTAIGNGIGSIANALGKLLTALSAKDDVHAINIAFGILRGTIELVTHSVKAFAKEWDAASGSIKEASKNIVRWADDVGRAYVGVLHTIEDFVHDSARDVKQWASDLANDFMDVVHAVGQWATDVHQWLDSVGAWIRSTFDRIVTDIREAWDKVVSYTRTIPGKILSALGDLGSLLVSGGEALIRGLISGIESAIPGLRSAVGIVHSLISDVFGGGGGGSSSGARTSSAVSAPQIRSMVANGPAVAAASNIHVHVDMSNIVSAPAQQQALQAHVQDAVLDFASRNAGSMLVLPTRRS